MKTMLAIPMITTAVLIPHIQRVQVQIARIKFSATVLAAFLILHSVSQTTLIKFEFDRTALELLGILTCFYIANIENGGEDVEELEEEEKKKALQRVVDDLTKFKMFFSVVTLISVSGHLKYQPLIISTLFMIEIIMKSVDSLKNFCQYVNLLSVFYIFVQVSPYCVSDATSLSQIIFISSILVFVFTVSKQILLFNSAGSIELLEFKIIRDGDEFWEVLKKNPNYNFILDRFWSFLLPIPLIFCIWSLSMFPAVIEPSILGLTAVFLSCSIIIQVHWSLVRFIVTKVFKALFTVLFLSFLIYEEPSTKRLLKSLLMISMLCLISGLEEVYKLIWEKSRSDPLPVMKSFSCSAKYRIYSDSLQRIWSATSPLASAVLISFLTIGTLRSKLRLLLLGLSTAAGLFIRSEGQVFWALIEIYVILEQSYLLFLSQNVIPSQLDPRTSASVLANILILLIAEGQRLNSIPSIFSSNSLLFMEKSKVKDSNNLTKPDEEEEEIEAASLDYENSFIWSSITFLEKVTSVTSLLALMATLIFYPQIVEVSFQTCVYSTWACLFTFLFYRPDVTAKLRLFFIGILSVISATFLIYNLYILPLSAIDGIKTIFYDGNGDLSTSGKCFVLHTLVFWFSCTALFVMQITSEDSQDSNCKEETRNGPEEPSSPVKSIEDSPKMAGSKLISEAGSVIERAFVLQWTRSCALLAFLAASFNPSLFGVVHILIGCILAWKNILSPRMYVPMILWLLCSTFAPAMLQGLALQDNQGYLSLLVGQIKCMKSTVCLTLWALILFLQPVFTRCLMKLTTEKERETGLVSFQLFPQDDSDLSAENDIESFENSSRYYISNWFLEFHNEIMVAVLLIGAVSRKNFYGIIYAILTLSHVLVPLFGKGKGVGILAKVSFFLQLICYIGEYFLSMFYNHDAFSKFRSDINQNPKSQLYAKFFGFSEGASSIILKSVLVGAYVLLTVRWYLTSRYYQDEKPELRFDNHWCRLCNKVSFKSKHAFSKIKHNIHLYLGWVSHAFLFVTAIGAFHKPTIPATFLLIFSLIFFFYGEASILIPKLRNNVYIVLGLILFWTLADYFMTAWFVFIIGDVENSIFRSNRAEEIYAILGMTNVLKYFDLSGGGVSVNDAVFDSSASKTLLGITVFLILLQIRLYSSKAWPFVIARLYQTYATSTKRAQLFNQNLQASISFQQRNLEKAAEHVKKQISSMKHLDISDWKKLCYAPKAEEFNFDEGQERLPEYGHGEADEMSKRSSIIEFRSHLDQVGTPTNSEDQENQHLDELNSACSLSPEELSKPLNIKEQEQSTESLLPSDQEAKKELHNLEGNFYSYTFMLMLRAMVKYFLSISHDYRRLLERPSSRSSLRIIFHHQSYFFRVQFLVKLLLDVINANFDYVLDYLVYDAQMFHSSGFSLFMVIGVLLVERMQRPYTSKNVHNFLLIFCAVWILFNFVKIAFWQHIYELTAKGNSKISNIHAMRVINQSILNRILGIHIIGTIASLTMRPTLILLALSYKRSLMRQLGLWDYGRGMQMARIYYQTEEDLDEIGEINVANNITGDLNDIDDDIDSLFSSADSSNEEETTEASIITYESKMTKKKSAAGIFKDLFWPIEKMPWRDFYVLIFVSDFICLFTTMYYWGDITLGPDVNGNSRNSGNTSFFSDMINQNMVPAALVNMVILSTFILVLDRALYVSKNYLGKYLLQIVTLIGYHIYMFFYLPQFYTSAKASGLFGIRLWYFCKWIYWIGSALQLKYNYPPVRTETFLATDYGIVGSTLHNVYRAIPFIEELKTIIDWSVTPSALGIWPWLKYSDIFERLYAVQCARAFQGTYFGRHQFGMPLNQTSKIMQGILFVGLSVMILWSPFLILSRSSMMTANTVRSFKLEISIENHGPAFLSFNQERFGNPLDPESDTFKLLRFKEGVNPFEVDPSFFTTVILPKVSEKPWRISELARKNLLEHLSDHNQSSFINVNWTVKRDKTQSVSTIKGTMRKQLSKTERADLIKLLDPETDKNTLTVAKISEFLPNLIKAPLIETSQLLEKSLNTFAIVKKCPGSLDGTAERTDTAESTAESTAERTAERTAESTAESTAERTAKRNAETKGLLKRAAGTVLYTGDEPVKECQFFLRQKKDDISIFIYSPKLPKYSFSSFNLVGLYATVVFTVAQLFRMMHADMTTRIQYDDLPNPAPLLIMCQQILMMRELGDFESEEAIYWQLIEILRNPQVLIEMTRKLK